MKIIEGFKDAADMYVIAGILLFVLSTILMLIERKTGKVPEFLEEMADEHYIFSVAKITGIYFAIWLILTVGTALYQYFH